MGVAAAGQVEHGGVGRIGLVVGLCEQMGLVVCY